MNVLVVGGGGREHALAWKISRSPLLKELTVAPGNAGTAAIAANVDVKADDVAGLVALAKEKRVDLVVVGPEAPLVAGLCDRLEAERIPVFGPSAKAAELEGSKAFAKAFMSRHDVPTAPFGEFTDLDEALRWIRTRDERLVVKADGLAAGKGVIVCDSRAEAESAVREVLSGRAVGAAAGARVVIERRLGGVEVSLLALTDGKAIVPLAAARDHKRAFDGDQGPNTGGMGAFSPVPDVDEDVMRQVLDRVLWPTVQGMASEGRPYRGVLYAGLMMESGQPWVLEFNARFGDPETQPLLARMKSDLLPLLHACATGRLEGKRVEWDARAAACVVMVAEGYPSTVRTGDVIEGLDAAAAVPDALVFHAGTKLDAHRRAVTAGGRVLGVTGLGSDVRAAAKAAYAACEKISWPGARYRKDIGMVPGLTK